MKSIEEKSNEYAKEYLFSPLPQRAPNVHFVAGANYVLECLERAIELNESTFVYSREKYIKVQVLNELIEKIRVK